MKTIIKHDHKWDIILNEYGYYDVLFYELTNNEWRLLSRDYNYTKEAIKDYLGVIL